MIKNKADYDIKLNTVVKKAWEEFKAEHGITMIEAIMLQLEEQVKEGKGLPFETSMVHTWHSKSRRVMQIEVQEILDTDNYGYYSLGGWQEENDKLLEGKATRRLHGSHPAIIGYGIKTCTIKTKGFFRKKEVRECDFEHLYWEQRGTYCEYRMTPTLAEYLVEALKSLGFNAAYEPYPQNDDAKRLVIKESPAAPNRKLFITTK